MNYTVVPSRTRTKRVFLSIIAAIALVASNATGAVAQEDAVGRTPPRLSYIDGEASFWRPGADDWSQAELNLPLAPGDQLYTAERTNIELQIGSRAYVRAAENTQFGLENQEPDFLQLRVGGGQVALDLRHLTPGHTVELDTPHAAFTIERAGYYRAIVNEAATTFVVRRGGSALVTPAGGASTVVASNQQAVIGGVDNPSFETFAAGELDDWDGWNYGRTDQLYASSSSTYVPDDVYGAQDLDNYGSWRNTPTYGSVWVPRSVPVGWAPYTQGRWIWDPYYEWTWLSSEPWGWAPYHYGRWVHYDDSWAWAPGPRVYAPVYSPALVAFFGGGGFSVGVSVPIAPVGWVSLSWGEPIYPWWGPADFCDRPYWGGWGGPRHVIHKTKIVNKTKIIHVDGYRNSKHRDGLVVVKGDRFGRGDVRSARLDRFDRDNLRPHYSKDNAKPTRASLRPREARGRRPPREVADRPVVATRSPRDNSSRLRAAGLTPETRDESRRVRLVDSPRAGRVARASQPDARVDRRRSTDVDDRASRATVPNSRSERQMQSPPNRQRRGGQEEGAAPAAPRSRTESQQPRMERQRERDDARQGSPPAPQQRSRTERQPDRRREAAPPAPRSRMQRPQRESRQVAPPAPQPPLEQRSQRREQSEMPQQQAAPRRESPRRSAPVMQPRQERSAPRQQAEPQQQSRRVEPRRESQPQSFSAVPQSRPQRQERIQPSQPQRAQQQVSRPQDSEQSARASRPQAERSSRSGGGGPRHSRADSRDNHTTD